MPLDSEVARLREEVARLAGTLRRVHGHYRLAHASDNTELCDVVSEWIYGLEQRASGLRSGDSNPLHSSPPISSKPSKLMEEECPF